MVDKLIGLPNTRPDALPSADHHRLIARSMNQQRLLVSLIRWCLPLALFVLVLTHELAVHVMTNAGLIHEENLFTDILIFGVLGPVALFGVITYIQRLLKAQWEIQAVLDELNKDLQRKVAERTAELEARNAELQQLDRMKSEFVALVSHELRAPLTTLHGGLELALQRTDHMSSEAQRILEIMRVECERLTTFVQDILDLSRLDAGQLPIVLGPVALCPMLERSIQIIVGDRRPIEWNLPPDHPLPIVDEIHLEEAVRAKARCRITQAGGWVCIWPAV
jgi:signal transduction histidine kinase